MFRTFAVLVASLFSSLAICQESAELRSYELKGNGSISLLVPNGWQEAKNPRQGSIATSRTIVFNSILGEPFNMLVTLMWMPNNMKLKEFSIPNELKKAFTLKKDNYLETDVSIEALNGATVQGSYYSATWRNPKPGEYKYSTEGIAKLGNIVLNFSIFTNNPKEITPKALALIQSIAHDSSSELSPAIAPQMPQAQVETVSRCIQEGSEFVKVGLFMALKTKKEDVLRPPRFPTGVPEERRRQIVNEIYDNLPENYRLFARSAFVRCASEEPPLFKKETLEYCFSLQARFVEFYIARDGQVPEEKVLAEWNSDTSLSDRPTVRRWGQQTIRLVYEGKSTLQETAVLNFLGCAQRYELGR